MFSNTSNYSTTNQTGEESEGFSPLVKGIFLGYYTAIFSLAFVGNVLALVTCYRTYRTTTSLLFCYIASLATADLLFTLLSTFDLAYVLLEHWPGGNVSCKIQSFLIEMSYTASVLTLVVISYERLNAVLRPILARSRKKNNHWLIVIQILWYTAIAFCVPLLYAYTVEQGKGAKDFCVNTNWGDTARQIYYGLQAFLLFFVSLLFMVLAHAKIFRVLGRHVAARNRVIRGIPEGLKQRKVTKMLALVTLLFAVCYVPFVVVRTLRYFYVYTGDETWRMVQLLIFTQAAFNPIIYCFYSNRFRLSYKNLLCCRRKENGFRKPRSSSTGSMMTSTFKSEAGLSFANLSFKMNDLDSAVPEPQQPQQPQQGEVGLTPGDRVENGKDGVSGEKAGTVDS